MFIFSVEQEVKLLKKITYDPCEVCGCLDYEIYTIKDIIKPLLIFKICVKNVFIAKCTTCSTTYTLSKKEIKELL